MTPEQLAKRFHETYEALAPQMGYETRKASAVPWESVPEKNRALMIATCNAILEDGIEADTIAALRAELAARDACIADARTVINRGVSIVTTDQLGQWAGVRAWLETAPYQPEDMRTVQLEAELAAAQAQVAALRSDNDAFWRYVRAHQAATEHEDRCPACTTETVTVCRACSRLESAEWAAWGEIMDMLQRNNAAKGGE